MPKSAPKTEDEYAFASSHWLKDSAINPRTGLQWEHGDELICSCGQTVRVGRSGFAGLNHHRNGSRHFKKLKRRIEAASATKDDTRLKHVAVADTTPVLERPKAKAVSRPRVSMVSSDDKMKDAEERVMSSIERLGAFRSSSKKTVSASAPAPTPTPGSSGSQRRAKVEDEEDHLQTLRMRQLLKDAKKGRLSSSSPLDSKISRKNSQLVGSGVRFGLTSLSSPTVTKRFRRSRKRDDRQTLPSHFLDAAYRRIG